MNNQDQGDQKRKPGRPAGSGTGKTVALTIRLTQTELAQLKLALRHMRAKYRFVRVSRSALARECVLEGVKLLLADIEQGPPPSRNGTAA